MIEVRKAKEYLDLMNGRWGWPFRDGHNSIGVYGNTFG